MRFVGVIGNKNAGKSSIIQSLTGCRSALFRDYIYGSANQSIYVCCSSPQEIVFEFQNQTDISAISAVMNQVIANAAHGCRGMVMAIQPNFPTSRPSIEDIFQQASASGFTSIFAFVVEPGYTPSHNIYLSVTNRLPGVANISQISGLDFPLINATAINNISVIVQTPATGSGGRGSPARRSVIAATR